MSLSPAMRSPAVRVSSVVLIGALIATGRSVVHVLRTTSIPPVPQTTIASLEPITRVPPPAPADLQAAVENDLFAPDRAAPSAPYRMPGERDPDQAPVVEPMKPEVLGTAVATDGRSFATLRLGGADASPVLVHVGDKIGDWTVKAIGRGKVTLVTSDGTRADLSLAKPGT